MHFFVDPGDNLSLALITYPFVERNLVKKARSMAIVQHRIKPKCAQQRITYKNIRGYAK